MKQPRRAWLEALVTLAVVAGGCVGKDPEAKDAPTTIVIAPEGGASDATTTPPADATSDAPTATATLAIAPARPRVRVGSTADVEIIVERRGMTGPLTLTVSGLPTGVTAAATTIAASETMATLKLEATAGATVGAAPFEIAAAGAEKLAATLVVAGAAGTLDSTFDGDGIVIDTSTATGLYYAVLPLADGSIVVAGATASSSPSWVIKKYAASGTPDAAFNTNVAGALLASGAAHALALDPSTNKIVVAGDSDGHFALARLNATGALDQSFGSAGIYVPTNVLDPGGSNARAVVVLPDSSILIGGQQATYALVKRFTAAGIPDESWPIFVASFNGAVSGIARLANGAIVAGGSVNGSPPRQFVLRLAANGAPDTTFGPDGGINAYADYCYGNGFALAANEDVVVTGWSVMAPTLCTTRVGTGDGGVVYADEGTAVSTGDLLAAARGPGETTYAAGHVGGSVERAGIVQRRFRDGGLDPAFATNGVYTIEDTVNVPDAFRFIFRAAATTSDGQLVLAGSRTGSISPGAFVMRLWE